MIVGGAISLIGIRNPRRARKHELLPAEDCGGGAVVPQISRSDPAHAPVPEHETAPAA